MPQNDADVFKEKRMLRFLHCADLHLDSPLRGLERYEGAPAQEMRDATRHAFINVIDLAIEKPVDFVVIAGDVFDGDWQDVNTGLFFANQLRRLGDAGIRAFIVRGNHDALSKITKSVPLPANTHVFASKKPETVIDEALGVAIHGQSFHSGVVTDDLAANYPDALPGLLNIGVLHTALAGSVDHEPYAPTTPARLREKGYGYWALGHVHTREIVSQDPWIVFPGNTQGRSVRELGLRGCIVVEGDAESGISSVEFVATDVARWAHLNVDVNGMSALEELQEAVQRAVKAAKEEAGDRLLALRLTLSGRTELHGRIAGNTEKLRSDACAWVNEASGGNAWLEKIKLAVAVPLDLAALAARDDPFGALVRRLDELAANPEEFARLAATALADLDLKIPADLKGLDGRIDGGFDLQAKDFLKEALASARERLLAGVSMEDTQ
jgi:DNA repair exonuclease SbcCD nuclease subunit